MEKLNFEKKVEGGKIIIDLPHDLDGKMVFVEIREQELDDNRVRKFSEMSVEDRLEVLKIF